jgi:hypothetical protein
MLKDMRLKDKDMRFKDKTEGSAVTAVTEVQNVRFTNRNI